MRDNETPRERPPGGVNIPLPGVQTAHDMEEAEEHFLRQDVGLESNELHASGRICARCGRAIGHEEDARRTVSGAYEHEFCGLS